MFVADEWPSSWKDSKLSTCWWKLCFACLYSRYARLLLTQNLRFIDVKQCKKTSCNYLRCVWYHMLAIIISVHKYRNDQYYLIILWRVKIMPGRELCLCHGKLETICYQCKVVSIEGRPCCHGPFWSTPCPLFIQHNDHLPYHYVLHR